MTDRDARRPRWEPPHERLPDADTAWDDVLKLAWRPAWSIRSRRPAIPALRAMLAAVRRGCRGLRRG